MARTPAAGVRTWQQALASPSLVMMTTALTMPAAWDLPHPARYRQHSAPPCYLRLAGVRGLVDRADASRRARSSARRMANAGRA